MLLQRASLVDATRALRSGEVSPGLQLALHAVIPIGSDLEHNSTVRPADTMKLVVQSIVLPIPRNQSTETEQAVLELFVIVTAVADRIAVCVVWDFMYVTI